MARSFFRLVAFTGLFSLTAIALSAAETPAPTPSPTPASFKKQMQDDGGKQASKPQGSPLAKKEEHHHYGHHDHHEHLPKDEYWQARKKLDSLHSHDHRSLKKNYKRWQKMPIEERKFFRSREAFERKWINKQIDNAIQKTGLKLTSEQRQQFAFRYMQKRRKIEQQLHKEMSMKRKMMVDKMLGQLKNEFSEPANPVKQEKPAKK